MLSEQAKHNLEHAFHRALKANLVRATGTGPVTFAVSEAPVESNSGELEML